jgi:hypothetical protein
MNKFYGILFLTLLFLLSLAPLQAQTIGDIIWQDQFDDAENDYLLNNVGWLYFGPPLTDHPLVGQVVTQTAEQTAFIKSGIYAELVAASLIITNGFSHVDITSEAITESLYTAQNANVSPNQDLTFRINFLKVESTFFLCGMRGFPPTGGYFDPLEDSTYVLSISPLENTTSIAKYSGENVALTPQYWTYLGQSTDFEYELNVWYWMEFYLYEGDLKVKIWEGELADGALEPWLLEITDPDPWVRGTWNQFGMLGTPIENGDEFELDDVVLREITSADAIDDGLAAVAPAKFALAENYPNPFNPATTIEFSLDKTSDVTLRIYAITGQLVRTLVSSNMAVGSHQVTFNGRDDLGNALASGVYFYQLQTTDNVATHKMILMK